MKKFISFSGGVESSAMCVLYGNKADAIFADTKYEHQKLYDRIEKVEKAVREFHGNDFKIIKVQKDEGGLPAYIKAKKFYPNFQARFCTRMFKIEPIDNYLKQFENEGAEIMIGLNADEIGDETEDPRTGNHGLLPFVKYSYPLADNGITREICIKILESLDLATKFPPFMKRGGCIGCYYKSRKEYEAMALLNPEEFKIVQDLEEEIQDKRDKFFSILPNKPMRQIKADVSNLLFKPEEIYSTINNATKCGVFCNR
ncbi:MAG: phosphoadenosine phosphosulfate reductase family protein [Bacteroidales bacterium]|nr:phosphoadenosine phosphosulfate reductase family protein [Bacteroidales bacterium]